MKYKESQWDQMETPTIFPRTPHEGLPVDSQIYLDSQWTPSGLLWDSCGTPNGLPVDSQWTPTLLELQNMVNPSPVPVDSHRTPSAVAVESLGLDWDWTGSGHGVDMDSMTTRGSV